MAEQKTNNQIYEAINGSTGAIFLGLFILLAIITTQNCAKSSLIERKSNEIKAACTQQK